MTNDSVTRHVRETNKRRYLIPSTLSVYYSSCRFANRKTGITRFNFRIVDEAFSRVGHGKLGSLRRIVLTVCGSFVWFVSREIFPENLSEEMWVSGLKVVRCGFLIGNDVLIINGVRFDLK